MNRVYDFEIGFQNWIEYQHSGLLMLEMKTLVLNVHYLLKIIKVLMCCAKNIKNRKYSEIIFLKFIHTFTLLLENAKKISGFQI